MKKIDEFIKLYFYLPLALSLMDDENHPDNIPDDFRTDEGFCPEMAKSLGVTERKQYEELIAEANNGLYEPFNYDEPGLLYDLLQEIDGELETRDIGRRIIFIEDALRKFYSALPFSLQGKCKLVLENNEKYKGSKYYNEKLSIADYIENCLVKFDIFFKFFDLKCFKYKCDLLKIQNNINIRVYLKRDNDYLKQFGYGSYVEEITVNSFPEYLQLNFKRDELIEKRNELAQMLKAEFKTERNIMIRSLLEALRRHDPALLIIVEGQFKEIFDSLKIYFNRDIGSYQGVQNPVFKTDKPPKSYKGIKERLDSLLERFNNAK